MKHNILIKVYKIFSSAKCYWNSYISGGYLHEAYVKKWTNCNQFQKALLLFKYNLCQFSWRYIKYYGLYSRFWSFHVHKFSFCEDIYMEGGKKYEFRPLEIVYVWNYGEIHIFLNNYMKYPFLRCFLCRLGKVLTNSKRILSNSKMTFPSFCLILIFNSLLKFIAMDLAFL